FHVTGVQTCALPISMVRMRSPVQARLGAPLPPCGPLVKWLRHRPFTAVTGVRIPYGSPFSGGLAQLGEHLPYKQGVGGSIPSARSAERRGGQGRGAA